MVWYVLLFGSAPSCYLRAYHHVILAVQHGDIEPGKVQAIGLGCDVANEDSVKAGFQHIVDKFGQIDSLVASAGAFSYPCLLV